MYGSLRTDVRDIFKKACDIEGIQLIEGAVCADHVHIYMAIPPKMSISTAMSKLKGKSALMIFDKYPRYRDKKWSPFLGSGILHRDNRTSERRNNQELYQGTRRRR